METHKIQVTTIQLDALESAAVASAVAAILTYPDATDEARAHFHALDSAGEKLAVALDQDWAGVKALFARSWAQTDSAQCRADRAALLEACAAALACLLSLAENVHPYHLARVEHRLVCDVLRNAIRAAAPAEHGTDEPDDENAPTMNTARR